MINAKKHNKIKHMILRFIKKADFTIKFKKIKISTDSKAPIDKNDVLLSTSLSR